MSSAKDFMAPTRVLRFGAPMAMPSLSDAVPEPAGWANEAIEQPAYRMMDTATRSDRLLGMSSTITIMRMTCNNHAISLSSHLRMIRKEIV